MLKLIDIQDLKVGMYIVPGESEKDKEEVYHGQEGLATEGVIELLAKTGLKKILIDLSRSDSGAFTASMAESEDIRTSQEQVSSERVMRTATLDEELPEAIKVQDMLVAYSRRFMTEIRKDRLLLDEADYLLDRTLDSIERNADALSTLARMRQSDRYLYAHNANVCFLTMFFARYQGIDRQNTLKAGKAALFHDLGKALMPPHIINAPRDLEKDEYEVMKTHPILGHERLQSAEGMDEVMLDAVLHHHERFDGSGYPDGLAGEEIAPLARVMSVVDVFDALCSRRPYKGAMFPHKSLGILYSMGGKELPYEEVALFIRMLGVYPVGSVVELEDGCLGVVIEGSFSNPARPKIAVVRDAEGYEIPRKEYDLAKEGPLVSRCLPKETVDIRPEDILHIPVF